MGATEAEQRADDRHAARRPGRSAPRGTFNPWRGLELCVAAPIFGAMSASRELQRAIVVHKDDVAEIARRGYEGAASTVMASPDPVERRHRVGQEEPNRLGHWQSASGRHVGPKTKGNSKKGCS